MKETYILGDFNINKYEIDKYIVYENKTICTTLLILKSITSFVQCKV